MWLEHKLSHSDFLVVRIDNKQVIIKQASQYQPGFYLTEDTAHLSKEELRDYKAYNAYQFLLNAKHPDTVKFIKAYPWIKDKDYVSMLFEKLLAPKVDSIIYSTQVTEVGPEVIKELMAHADSAGFWKMKVNDGLGSGFDGATWDLEITANGKHHYVHYWSPQSGGYYDLCRHILRYTQLKDKDIY